MQLVCIVRAYASKQPPELFFGKSCSENMQQISRRTLMLKRHFNIVASQLY